MKQLVDKARCVIQTKKTRNNVVKEKNNTKNIFYAITKCDFNATKKFLDKGALVNGVSSRGLSPIYLGNSFVDSVLIYKLVNMATRTFWNF